MRANPVESIASRSAARDLEGALGPLCLRERSPFTTEDVPRANAPARFVVERIERRLGGHGARRDEREPVVVWRVRRGAGCDDRVISELRQDMESTLLE